VTIKGEKQGVFWGRKDKIKLFETIKKNAGEEPNEFTQATFIAAVDRAQELILDVKRRRSFPKSTAFRLWAEYRDWLEGVFTEDRSTKINRRRLKVNKEKKESTVVQDLELETPTQEIKTESVPGSPSTAGTTQLDRIEWMLSEVLSLLKEKQDKEREEAEREATQPLYEKMLDLVRGKPPTPEVVETEKDVEQPKVVITEEERIKGIKFVVVGCLNEQQNILRNAYPEVKFRFYTSDQHAVHAYEGDHVFCLANFMNHPTWASLKTKVDKDHLHTIHGGMTKLKESIRIAISKERAKEQDALRQQSYS
jgi:hypothetical protein